MNSTKVTVLNGIEEVTHRLLLSTLFTAGPVILLGSFGNICVIVLFIRKKGLRTTSISLTVALMFFSLNFVGCAYPVQCLLDLFFFTSQPWCYLIGSILPTASVQVTVCLFVLTVERYIAIVHPFMAGNLFTTKRVTLIAAFIALYSYSFSYGIGALVWIGKGELWRQTRRCNWLFVTPSKNLILATMLHWMILIPIMVILFAHLFITVRRHIRSISSVQPATSQAPSQPVLSSPTNSRNENTRSNNHSALRISETLRRRTNRRMLREAKSALRLFFVFVIYICNWVPFTIFVVTGVLSEENVSPMQYVILHTFVYSAGAVAPYIYGFGNRRIFREIKVMILPRSCTTLADDSGNTVHFISTRTTRQDTREIDED
ncbi:Beta-2 adrenergic receptor [Holothuria leucospilota]|uniref:Beta-2 adrenergic receptor n=1 Tax=Holothuria leucospilota TaxID=206669 RepID=A0A9Q1HC18_HOLLE|nr:Beta-2 adrenergic receptor [Holothuria leucospilota]